MPDKPVPAGWRGRPVVVLVGGPWGRRWYFTEDLEQLVASHARIGMPWHYQPTRDFEPHPTYATVGTIHRWRPPTTRRRA